MIRQIHQRLRSWQGQLTRRYGMDISGPSARRAAAWHFQLLDHAFLRVWWTNLHEIAPGVWRSNQPSPERLATHAAQGFKTVINLRGTSRESFWLFEQEACAAHGLQLINLKLTARKAPTREQIGELLQIMADAPRPVLLHCKSGADRTGLAAALYLLVIAGRPLEDAQAQLSFRYWHLRRGPAGILDHILRSYARATQGRSISFLDWVATDYDPEEIAASFRRWRAGGKDGAW
jgi:protein tyrosine phosphatase (PTP) superfamily phosphohydrolase (DUF442 family)